MNDPDLKPERPERAESDPGPSRFGPGARSGLARLWLPGELLEPQRNLAWTCSVCALFLLIGLAGLMAPASAIKPRARAPEHVEVALPPPPDAPAPSEPVPATLPPEPTPVEAPPEEPTLLAVEAALNPPAPPALPAAQLAVPVPAFVPSGSTPAAPAPLQASAGSGGPGQRNGALTTVEPSAPKRFYGAADGGSYPQPLYPRAAQRNRFQGTVTIDLRVAESGAIESATVAQSSGFKALDEAALEVVKTRWRFPAGERRHFVWDCTFQLN